MDKFTLGIGGTTALCEPFYRSWPEQILFTPSSAFNKRGDIFIGYDGHSVSKLIILAEIVIPPEV